MSAYKCYAFNQSQAFAHIHARHPPPTHDNNPGSIHISIPGIPSPTIDLFFVIGLKFQFLVLIFNFLRIQIALTTITALVIRRQLRNLVGEDPLGNIRLTRQKKEKKMVKMVTAIILGYTITTSKELFDIL